MRDKFLTEFFDNNIFSKYLDFKYVYVIDKPVTKYYKISICTNCMNRANDVKKTLLRNILDNIDYPGIEFVLLNYNSQDDLDEWVKDNMMSYINLGILKYYKTTEPKYYSMTHSRNVEFKLAKGDIVNNVDGDHFINKGFAERINLLANQRHKRLVFVKSKQKNRGRLGFFKKEFMWLGGYDEQIKGYGFDDEDLIARAYHSGLELIKFGGDYMNITDDHRRHVMDNYEDRDWKYTQRKNTVLSLFNLSCKKYKANCGKEWGKVTVIKNFKEEVRI